MSADLLAILFCIVDLFIVLQQELDRDEQIAYQEISTSEVESSLRCYTDSHVNKLTSATVAERPTLSRIPLHAILRRQLAKVFAHNGLILRLLEQSLVTGGAKVLLAMGGKRLVDAGCLAFFDHARRNQGDKENAADELAEDDHREYDRVRLDSCLLKCLLKESLYSSIIVSKHCQK